MVDTSNLNLAFMYATMQSFLRIGLLFFAMELKENYFKISSYVKNFAISLLISTPALLMYILLRIVLDK